VIIYIFAFILTIFFAYKAAGTYKEYVRVKTSYAGANRSHKVSAYKLQYVALFILAFLPLFLISALRYGVGTDYFFTYYPQFYNILNGGSNVYSEWGFFYLNKAIQLFTDDAQWLFVVTSFIFVFFLIKTIINQSSNVFISLLVVLFSGIFFASLNNIRQAIAVVLCFAAFPSFVDKKYIRCSLYLLCAFLFHKIALIMLCFYIVVQLKLIRKYFLPITIILTLLLPLLCKLFLYIISLTKYSYYLTDYNLHKGTTLNIIYHLYFFIVSYVVLGKNIRTDSKAYVLIFAQFASFYVSAISIFIGIPELITRLTFSFQIFQVLLIPYVFINIKDRRKRNLFLILFILLYGFYFIRNFVLGNAHEILPYQWIFTNK